MYKCKKCNKKYNVTFGSGIYCSRKCANSRSHTEATKHKISKTLKGRDIGFTKGSKHSEKSKKLMSKSKIKLLKVDWKNLPYEKLSRRSIRKRIFYDSDHKCEECGYNKIDKNENTPLQIHHIDGNKKNNTKNNLQLLCANCHYFTDNWSFRGRKHKKLE